METSHASGRGIAIIVRIVATTHPRLGKPMLYETSRGCLFARWRTMHGPKIFHDDSRIGNVRISTVDPRVPTPNTASLFLHFFSRLPRMHRNAITPRIGMVTRTARVRVARYGRILSVPEQIACHVLPRKLGGAAPQHPCKWSLPRRSRTLLTRCHNDMTA